MKFRFAPKLMAAAVGAVLSAACLLASPAAAQGWGHGPYHQPAPYGYRPPAPPPHHYAPPVYGHPHYRPWRRHAWRHHYAPPPRPYYAPHAWGRGW